MATRAGDAVRAALLRRRAGLLPPRVGGDRRADAHRRLRPRPARRARRVPALYLPGRALTCTEETFAIKAGAQRAAASSASRSSPATPARARRAIRATTPPRTSASAPASTSTPPQAAVATRPTAWTPTSRRELPAVVEAALPGAARRARASSATRWAATARWRSRCATPAATAASRRSRRSSRRRGCRGAGRRSRATSGTDEAVWAAYDACALVRAANAPDDAARRPGTADKFLDAQLKPELFEAACAAAGQQPALRRHARLRPQLLLHRQLRRRSPRAPRARARALMSAVIKPAARRRLSPSRSRPRP